MADNFGRMPRPARTTCSRPSILNFPPRVEVQQGQELQLQDVQDQLIREWAAKGEKFPVSISLRDCMDLRMEHMPRNGNKGQHVELLRKINKFSFPSYDGTGKMTARAWIQKLDMYF